jgi:hypothetical protein
MLTAAASAVLSCRFLCNAKDLACTRVGYDRAMRIGGYLCGSAAVALATADAVLWWRFRKRKDDQRRRRNKPAKYWHADDSWYFHWKELNSRERRGFMAITAMFAILIAACAFLL